jgi:hypothetical protein
LPFQYNLTTTMTSPDPKIIDLLNEKKQNGEILVSLEYFPPRTETGVQVCPLFCSVHGAVTNFRLLFIELRHVHIY